MPDKLDMGLDDIAKMNKNSRGGGAGRGRGAFRGRGGPRRGASAGLGGARRGGIMKRRSGGPAAANTSPFKAAGKLPDGKWLHDMYGGQPGLRRSSGGLSTGPTKILISNLDYGVNDKDIKELFQDFGAIRKAAVHYDRSGRSLGTADVLFEKRQDAIKALSKYNGVQLDGRAMEITLATNTVGAGAAFAAAAVGGASAVRGGFARRGAARGGRGGFRGGFRGGARGGGARGGTRAAKTSKTQAELDADLDTYTKMQTD